MIVRAYAKVNWHLSVLGRRQDGYHLLDMVMQRIDLHDDIVLVPAEGLSLTAEGLPVETGPDNLILRAARALQQASGTDSGAQIHLTKRIPLGAGLGGGSADAAAVLQGLNALWGLGCSKAELQRLGAGLGADVPYCLEMEPARVGGVGEAIRPLSPFAPCSLVLRQPEAALNTREVFARFDAGRAQRQARDAEAVIEALSEGGLERLRSCAVNDLQSPAEGLLPEISTMINELYAAGASFAQMTGSGSAVYGAFPVHKKARAAYQTLQSAGPGRVWLCRCL